MLNRLEHQIKYTSNGITYQVTGHTLVDMRQAMRRKEESMKHKKLRRQVHDNIEVAHIPEINDSPIPRSKRRVVEFNVENRMKTLQVTIDNEGWSKSRIIKPSANNKVGQFWGLTRTHKKRLQRSKAMNKMKQSLAVIANLKARRQGENSLS